MHDSQVNLNRGGKKEVDVSKCNSPRAKTERSSFLLRVCHICIYIYIYVYIYIYT